jgi:hypothetical protein
MTVLDPRPDGASADDLLDAALPAALLVAAASWLPAGLLLLGYTVRVLDAARRGDDGIPGLDDARGLGRSGVRALAVVVASALPGLFCFGIAVAAWYVVDGGRFYGDPVDLLVSDPHGFVSLTVLSPGAGVVVALALLLTGVVTILASYAGSVALVTLAATGRLGAAFDLDVLRAGFGSPSFRRSFLLASVLGFVGFAVAALVSAVPVVGPFVGAFVELFVLVAVLRLVAKGYTTCPVLGTASAEDDTAPSTPPTTNPTL